jgi:hypothetical protein
MAGKQLELLLRPCELGNRPDGLSRIFPRRFCDLGHRSKNLAHRRRSADDAQPCITNNNNQQQQQRQQQGTPRNINISS